MSIEILTGDFRNLSRDLADNSIDLVLTDPPYPKEYLPLWEDLGRMAARVLKPGKFLIAYTGHLWLDEAMIRLSKHLTYYWLCGIHLEGPRTRFWNRQIWVKMRPVLIYAKKPIKPQPRWFADSLIGPAPDKRYHKWGQSLPPLRYLLEHFSNEDDLVLDSFLGGGTTAVACLQTNRRFIGYEINPDTADIARRRVAREKLFTPQHDPVQLTIETIGLPRCRFCGAVLASNGGPGRKRDYCSDICRLRAFRFRQAELKRNSIGAHS